MTIMGLAKQFYAAGPHPVQAVRSCSWPECMVMKCTHVIGAVRFFGPENFSRPGFLASLTFLNLVRRLDPDNLLTAQAIEGFVANAPNKTKLRLGLQRNFSLVTTKAHPCLKWDFQVCAQRWCRAQHRPRSLQTEYIWICVSQRHGQEQTGK